MNKEKQVITVWVSKYALTSGIFEMKAEKSNYTDMVSEIANPLHCFHKPYWHEQKEEAIKHAEEMRIKKLKSLEKQIKKISILKFD